MFFCTNPRIMTYFLTLVLVAVYLKIAISDNVVNISTTASPFELPAPNIKKINITLVENFVNDVYVQKLLDAFTKNKFEFRVVGGAVRDILMNIRPKDLDFATDATPDQMKYIFKQEEIRTIDYSNGEKHGTITAHLNGTNFEITTLRKDDVCFGRHARVSFTESWQEDAARRDLTINSMFLGLDGTLYDYCGGEEDVKQRKVRFVGDPSTRIREDYLRIMRYFRFYGRVSNDSDNHDPEILRAIRENKIGLSNISGERLWLEFQQILVGKMNRAVVYKMLEVGLGPFLGLGDCNDLNRTCFENVYKLRNKYEFKPITYLAALLPNETRVTNLVKRLKLSNFDRDLAIFLITHRSKPFVSIREQPLRSYQPLLIEAKNNEQIKMFTMELLQFLNPTDNPLTSFQKFVIMTELKRAQVREFTLELFRYHDREDLIEPFKSWEVPHFPIIKGEHLLNKGIKRKEIGLVMNKMKELWVESDFQFSAGDLLEKLPEIMKELALTFNEKKINKNSTKIETSS